MKSLAERLIPTRPGYLAADGPSGQPPDWLWQGYLARGCVTLLTSFWKTGKTTLMSVLLDRMQGGGEIAGRAVASGKAVVVTEEPLEMWQQRRLKLNLDHHLFHSRPYRGAATAEHWRRLMQILDETRERESLALIVIDSLAHFLPIHAENTAGGLLPALCELQRLAAAGAAVLLLHHPKKGAPELGQAARGSGALMGFADIVLEMRRVGGPCLKDRRRRIVAFSRFDDTPRDLVLEWTPEGVGYAACGELADVEFRSTWTTLYDLLATANQKLTRRDILELWPTAQTKPSDQALWRWLDHGVEKKLIAFDGSGTRNDAFRYWLAERKVVSVDLDKLLMDGAGDLPPLTEEVLLPIGQEKYVLRSERANDGAMFPGVHNDD